MKNYDLVTTGRGVKGEQQEKLINPVTRLETQMILLIPELNIPVGSNSEIAGFKAMRDLNKSQNLCEPLHRFPFFLRMPFVLFYCFRSF